MEIKLAGLAEEQRWDAYVAEHGGLPYSLFAWKSAVEKAYGFSCPYLYAEKNGRIQGVLPLVHLKPPFLSGIVVSLPYCDAGGVLADTLEATAGLWQRGLAIGQKHASAMELRSTGKVEGLAMFDSIPLSKVRMVLALPESAEQLLGTFKAKLRSQVKKTTKDGLVATLGGIELLDGFYSIFCEGMRDLGSPPHSRDWFKHIIEGFGERARVGVVAMPDGSLAAGGIMLCCGSVVTIPWAATRRSLNRWSPNMLLYWTFLSFAAERGFKTFDFGRSTPGGGTYRFKEQWGAQPVPLCWYRYRRVRSQTEKRVAIMPDNTNGGVRHALAKALQQLPVPVSNWLGARMRRFIPL